MKINTSRMLELALVFFVSLLSFSIGTYVGKKYSDNQHRLAQLEPKKGSHNTASAEGHDEGTAASNGEQASAHGEQATTGAGHDSGAITDADVAKMAEEFAQDEETNGKPIAEVDEKGRTVTAAGEKTKKPMPSTTSSASTAHSSTAHSSSEGRAVASIPETTKNSDYFYTVQVGSYPTANDAEKMTETLKARGYKATSMAADVNGKTFYRVQVGMFSNLQDAQAHKKELIEQNRLSSAFIQRVQR